MKVNLFCRFNHTGIGRHAENFARALRHEAGSSFFIAHVDPDNMHDVQRMLDDGRDDDVTLFFTLQYAPLAESMKGRKILWLAFESNRFPSKWRDLLGFYDAVWVPSAWGRDVLIASGVAAGKISVVAEGVDASVYYPKPIAHESFVFLAVGKYEKRKSINECIQAFIEEFPRAQYPDVKLALKADFPMFPERVQTLKASLAVDDRMQVLDGTKTDAEMVALYNSADAYLFPSRAEGFGLPCLEAIACGVPVLATPYSGQTEYLKEIENLYLPIDYVMEDIADNLFDHFFKDVYAGEAYGEWARPDIASLKRAMRDVYENCAGWNEKGLQASAVIRQKFDWAEAAKRAIIELTQ